MDKEPTSPTPNRSNDNNTTSPVSHQVLADITPPRTQMLFTTFIDYTDSALMRKTIDDIG
jgi:hypothetical protein